ncbi:hypothetical protein PUN28_017493 [Cardiocondyla obscurior]|uniref:Uncharacterized protein n=1 Tax=Cardiocondyla obscurior TaxID=286306 RepID=A0AAW2EIL0_9HYME
MVSRRERCIMPPNVSPLPARVHMCTHSSGISQRNPEENICPQPSPIIRSPRRSKGRAYLGRGVDPPGRGATVHHGTFRSGNLAEQSGRGGAGVRGEKSHRQKEQRSCRSSSENTILVRIFRANISLRDTRQTRQRVS